MTKPQFIYVICESSNADTVKIGFSCDPARRARQLQTGAAGKLHVHYQQEVAGDQVRVLERILHKTLAHHRARGEWFKLTPEDATAEVKHAVIRYGDVDNLDTRFRNGNLV